MRVSVPSPMRRALGRRSSRPAVPAVACRAPFTSMYLDQHGNVRACCMNDRHLLGNVTETPLVELWRGGPAQELRRAMERDDLSLGCDFCAVHVDAGRPDLAYSRGFEQFGVEGHEPPWPRQLELSLTNTCNLRCVMCNGEWSSSIRAKVERRPPLPTVYDDGFFEGLRPFLPHLERVKFYGGEPLLASETLRVMEMLVEEGLSTRCHVTTNGTQWTPRVERLLSMLPVDVAVSLDAATAETYEAVRRGSSWAQVRRNLDRFVERAERRGTWVSTTFCLMTVNWHELGDWCLLADELGIAATVNDVSQPDHLSLYRLPLAELEVVVEALEARDAELAAALGQNLQVWSEELVKLRRHLRDERALARLRPGPPEVPVDRPRTEALRMGTTTEETADDHRDEAGSAVEAEVAALRARFLTDRAPRVDLDGDGRVRWVEPGGVLSIRPEALLGRHHDEIREVVSDALGPIADVANRQVGGGVEVNTVRLADGAAFEVLSLPAPDDHGPPGATLYFSNPRPESTAAPDAP